MYFRRSIEDCWIESSNEFPVLLLTGPRQVGKTTVLEHISKPSRIYVSLDDINIRTFAKEEPELFLQKYPPPIFIDEIQYAPELLPYIKIYVDKYKKGGSFWLTGSQQFQLMKNITETLAGRVAIINLLGFSQREKNKNHISLTPFLPKSKDLLNREKSYTKKNILAVYNDIWLGSFPFLVSHKTKNRDLFYTSYMQTYLQRDIRDLAQVGNIEDFNKFLRACAARTGQLLNISELAKDVDISVKTAKKWLSVLIASFQVYLLYPYHTNITKRLIKTPKLYFLDTGLCSYLTGWSSSKTLEAGAMSGAIFETYVFAEILKSWWHRLETPQIYYYRDKDGKEIDIIIIQDNNIYPIEIKKSSRPSKEWIKNFTTLQRFNGKSNEGAVICMTNALLPIDNKNMAVPISLL